MKINGKLPVLMLPEGYYNCIFSLERASHFFFPKEGIWRQAVVRCFITFTFWDPNVSLPMIQDQARVLMVCMVNETEILQSTIILNV